MLAALVFGSGLQIGNAILGSSSPTELTGDLQQIQTASGTYLGRVVADDASYIRVADAAIVTKIEGAEGQYQVRMLASEPFALVGDVLLPHEAILLIGSIDSDAPVASAYAEAMGR